MKEFIREHENDIELSEMFLSAILETFTLLTKLHNDQQEGFKHIMAGISDIKTAQAGEKADLVTLTGLITQLLALAAASQLSPADAQGMLDEITAEDATVKSSIASIAAALPPVTPPVTPVTPAP